MSQKFCLGELEMGINQTIDYYSYMGEVCAADVLGDHVKIGGERMTVEIDEAVH